MMQAMQHELGSHEAIPLRDFRATLYVDWVPSCIPFEHADPIWIFELFVQES